jgi:hypothetical protein
MYDDFQKTLEHLRTLSDTERAGMTTWVVVEGLLMLARYIVTGIVVFVLGRRIINAFAFSMKPVRDQEKSR